MMPILFLKSFRSWRNIIIFHVSNICTLSTLFMCHVILLYSYTEEGLPSDQITAKEWQCVDNAEECIAQCLIGYYSDWCITTLQEWSRCTNRGDHYSILTTIIHVTLQGLACVYTLCEMSDAIAEHFITGGIHNLLLTILQQVKEDGDNINNDDDCKYHPLTMVSSCHSVYCD